ncbi:hypothetical protein GCM10009087_51820 [Sphingomonas oligophenolica]|uniref:Response regulator n=1 Tax=Sphingomonas oligophenolica TaxID=301154 RepID=A0ABU9Y6S9_9SPHN
MAVILVVDDDRFVRESVEWLIRDMGHVTLAASGCDSALEQLSAPQHIDALLVDIRLGSRAYGGCEIAERAVGIRPGLRVLYTSGRPLTPETAGHFVRGGRFLEKPYSFDRLESSVAALLH